MWYVFGCPLPCSDSGGFCFVRCSLVRLVAEVLVVVYGADGGFWLIVCERVGVCFFCLCCLSTCVVFVGGILLLWSVLCVTVVCLAGCF